MPVYGSPALPATVSPKLEKRMQGKACFNFVTIDEDLFAELEDPDEAGDRGLSQPRSGHTGGCRWSCSAVPVAPGRGIRLAVRADDPDHPEEPDASAHNAGHEWPPGRLGAYGVR
jgi:hypothetical protein